MTCRSPDVFETADGDPLSEAGKEDVVSEPWQLGGGCREAACAWAVEA